jgi:hypothetical protein
MIMAKYGVVVKGRDEQNNYLAKEIHGKTLHPLLLSARAELRGDQPIRMTRMDRDGSARIWYPLGFDQDLDRLCRYARSEDAEAILLYDSWNDNPETTEVLMLAGSENQLEQTIRGMCYSWRAQPDRILSTQNNIYWARGSTIGNLGTESEDAYMLGKSLCAPVEWLTTRRQEGKSIRWGIDTDVALLCAKYLHQAGGLH